MRLHLRRRLRCIDWVRWIGFASVAGALAALLRPGPTTELTGIAAALCVCGVALAAGHRWAAGVVAIADVLLLSKLWPIVSAPTPLTSDPATLAPLVATLAALPGVVLLTTSMGDTMSLMFGRIPVWVHRTSNGVATAACMVWLAAPIV